MRVNGLKKIKLIEKEKTDMNNSYTLSLIILILIISGSVLSVGTTLSDPCECPEHMIGADDPFDCGCFGAVKTKKDIEEAEQNAVNVTDTHNTTLSPGGVHGEPINDREVIYSGDGSISYMEKSGLWPLTRREFLATLIIAVGSAFISYGGIGGGIYIPTLMIVAGYTVEVSLPISATIVFGSFLASLIFIVFRKHPNYPKVNRPRIDYDLAAIASPIMGAGSAIGVIFNLVFPRWLTLIVMVIVLLFSSGTVFKWGIQELRQYIRDGKVKSCGCAGPKKCQDEEEETEGEEDSTSSSSFNTSESSMTSSSESSTEDKDLENQSEHRMVKYLKKYESFQIQPFQLSLFFIIQGFITLVSYLRGSKYGGSIIGIELCGDTWYWYWILTLFNILFLILVTYLVSAILYFVHRFKEKRPHLFTTAQSELGVIPWTARNSFLFPVLFFVVGIIVGFLGICGCMVYSPIFLQLGVLSEVSCATSTALTIFTNGSTMIQYFFMGRLDWEFTLFYGATAFFAALVGRFALSYPIEKLKMRFVLTFIIAIVILGGTFAIASLQISVLWKDWNAGEYERFKFRPICD